MTSTRTTRLASSFSARRCAAVAPTLPAPTTVILLTMAGKLPYSGGLFHLTQGLVQHDAHRRREVEAADPTLEHRDAIQPIGVLLADSRGQSVRFTAKHQHRASAIRRLPERPLGVRREVQAAPARDGGTELVPRRVHPQ